ncbi:hypothetical protein [Sphingomonas sp. IW22]|uniref:hypothetical protein n=1 Tax=Sphingomonas sp. IW22 TaxID=3242489 RepID=UPI003522AFA1
MRSTQYRREADAARAATLNNAARLKQRLAPSTLINDAVETAQAKAMAAVETAQARALVATEQTIETVRARPALAGSIAGGVLLLVAGKPLFRLFRGKRHDDATDPNITDIELAEGHPS